MSSLLVLFAGKITDYAFEEIDSGKSAFDLTLKRCAGFPGLSKIIVFAREDFPGDRLPGQIEGIEVLRKESWNTRNLLEALAKEGEGYDFTWFAWADTPLMDCGLAARLFERHRKYPAEYSYADGFPGGLAPELLSPGTAAFLLKLNGEEEAPVERTTLFDVLQKDINSFDIETEISPVDYRSYRLNLACNTKRNTLLVRRFLKAGWKDHRDAERIITGMPELLRTLPAFFPVMITPKCPVVCKWCPAGGGLPGFKTGGPGDRLSDKMGNEMSPDDFNIILDKIAGFSDDAVIDLSLWGEPSMHGNISALLEAALRRDRFSLIVETCALGWSAGTLAELARLKEKYRRSAAEEGDGTVPKFSVIVSLDSADADDWTEFHGGGANCGGANGGFAAALGTAKELFAIFRKDFHVQALRTRGREEELEKFYRFWNGLGANVIVQKYDWFCGRMEDLRAGDISPLIRPACHHIMRDMPVLLDGSVAACREAIVDFPAAAPYGNLLTEDISEIWERGAALYREHCAKNFGGLFGGLCEKCDEYYTFNF